MTEQHALDDVWEAAALAFSKLTGGTSIYRYVPVGERFAFPTNARRTPCVSQGDGWYSMEGKRFRTGMHTAVIYPLRDQ